MNFMDGRLVKKDGKYAVQLEGICVILSDDKQQRLKAKDVAEQEVTVGVRPEHMLLADSGYKGTVEVSELMGSSVHVHMTDTHGRDMVVILNDKKDFSKFSGGAKIDLTFAPDAIHVFDKETEKNLEW